MPDFLLPRPPREAWSRELYGPGWVTEVSQSTYGHWARKRTWLYAVTDDPPLLNWSEAGGRAWVGWGDFDRYPSVPRVTKKEAAATPIPFRDALLSIARGASPPSAGTIPPRMGATDRDAEEMCGL